MRIQHVEDRLTGHEEVCAERYANIHARIDKIETVLNKLLWTIIAGFGAVVVSVLMSKAQAEEVSQYMAMSTDVGYVILSIEPCSDNDIARAFPYKVVATDKGHDDHEGCWNATPNEVGVLYFEVGYPVVYDKSNFKPYTPL